MLESLRRTSLPLLFASVLVLACQSSGSSPRSAPGPQLPEFSPQQRLEATQAGEKIVFLVVREPQEFTEAYIPGAINVPQQELAAAAPEGERRELVFVADRSGESCSGSSEWDRTDLQVMKRRPRVEMEKP